MNDWTQVDAAAISAGTLSLKEIDALAEPEEDWCPESLEWRRLILTARLYAMGQELRSSPDEPIGVGPAL